MKKLSLLFIIVYAICALYLSWFLFPLPDIQGKGCCSAKACARDMHHQ